MESVKRGALIVVEGVDRSGKSTQCKMLVDELKKRDVQAMLMQFPDRTTKTGQLIDEYLKNKSNLSDQAIHLLFAANRWENVDKIKKHIYEGKTLVIDRYSFSGIVFSSAKGNEEMNIEWCKQPEIGLPKPDLVLLLTLSKEAMMKRPGFGNERYENPAMQKRVTEMYYRLKSEDWKEVEADGSIEDVNKILIDYAIQTIENVSNTKLGLLEFKDSFEGKITENQMKENINIGNLDEPAKKLQKLVGVN